MDIPSDPPAAGSLAATARTARQQLPRLFGQFWPLTKPDRRVLGAAAGLLVLAAAADTIAVWMFSDIVDGMAGAGGLSTFWRPAGWWAAAAVTGAITTFTGTYLTHRAAERFQLRLRDRAFTHLQRLGPDFFARHSLGDLVARLSGDLHTIEALVSSGLVHLVVAASSVLFYTAAVFVLRWDLALVVAALAPLLLLATRRLTRRLGQLSRAERATNGAMTARLEESIANIPHAQAHATEHRHADQLRRHGHGWMRIRVAQARVCALYTPLTELLETLALLTVLGVGAWEITAGRISLGGLVGFATYLGFLFNPLQRLGELLLGVSEARASGDRLAEILGTHPTVTDPAGPWVTDAPARRGLLEITDLRFGYPGTDTPVLRDLTISLQPGQLVALTGPSGSGKSTLANLLLRFHDPLGGRISLDGTDLRHYTLAALRHSITLLPQQPVILTGSIADNIAYGSPHATDEQVARAAREAGAHEFITALPLGYRTMLGHRGPQLSGGQRQRIALARAFLRDTPLLILDEPTTGLDPVARTHLTPTLRNLTRHRTTLLITHDPDLARLADTVLALDKPQAYGRPLATKG